MQEECKTVVFAGSVLLKYTKGGKRPQRRIYTSARCPLVQVMPVLMFGLVTTGKGIPHEKLVKMQAHGNVSWGGLRSRALKVHAVLSGPGPDASKQFGGRPAQVHCGSRM
jgi:hypothetical protein